MYNLQGIPFSCLKTFLSIKRNLPFQFGLNLIIPICKVSDFGLTNSIQKWFEVYSQLSWIIEMADCHSLP